MPSKYALITGASKGIGRATALALADLGFFVLATARNEKKLNALCKEIRDNGGEAQYIVADLLDGTSVENLINQAKSTCRHLSVMVHCAGIAEVGTVAEMHPDQWRKVIDINLTAPFVLTQQCVSLFERGTQIFFINSVAGKKSFSEWAAYCASKAGLKAFADALRQELRPAGVRVVSIFPASVDTSMHNSLPYHWDRGKMLRATDVAAAVASCCQQPPHVLVKEIDLENSSGTF